MTEEDYNKEEKCIEEKCIKIYKAFLNAYLQKEKQRLKEEGEITMEDWIKQSSITLMKMFYFTILQLWGSLSKEQKDGAIDTIKQFKFSAWQYGPVSEQVYECQSNYRKEHSIWKTFDKIKDINDGDITPFSKKEIEGAINILYENNYFKKNILTETNPNKDRLVNLSHLLPLWKAGRFSYKNYGMKYHEMPISKNNLDIECEEFKIIVGEK